MPGCRTSNDRAILPASLAAHGEGPTFQEPWEAQAFSMAVGLSERGVFTWAQWTEALAEAIGDPATANSSYYEKWLLALERLLKSRGLVSQEELAERREAWRAAALATPHGQPVVLPAGKHGSHVARVVSVGRTR